MKNVLLAIALIFTLLSCKDSDFEKTTFLGPKAQFTESGMEYIMLKEGDGSHAEIGNEITAVCLLRLGDSTVVWEAPQQAPFNFVHSTTGMIRGFVEAIGMLDEGDKIKVIIPPDLGYGNRASEQIPANAYLSYEIELIKVDDPKLWVADTLLVTFQNEGKDKGIAQYIEMKEDSMKFNLNERQLGVLGSLLKRDGRLNDYMEVAKLRVDEYPESFGAHLNLANIYIDRGEKTFAREELNKCLEIDEDNPTILRKLEEL
jgi:tetratricopeptide (TPR) repeat protein